MPVYKLIALWGSPQEGQRHSRIPKERDNYVLEDNFQKILRKNLGLKKHVTLISYSGKTPDFFYHMNPKNRSVQ
jgi:hypothetical protein